MIRFPGLGRSGGLAIHPWAISFTLAVALLAAAAIGRLWSLLALLPILAFVGWALFDGPRVQRATLCFLFISQVLVVVPWLRPQEFNYYAYAVAMMLLSGVLAAVRGCVRFDRMWWFIAWMFMSAMYGTLSINPSPFYGLLLLPFGAAGAFLLLDGSRAENGDVFLRLLLAFAVVQALLGLAQTLFDIKPFVALGDVVYSEPRNYLAVLVPGLPSQVRMATGTFAHFNGLGSLFSLVTPIAFGAWLEDRAPRRLFLLLILWAGLVATFSRGALLGALIGSLLVYWSVNQAAATRVLRAAVLALAGGLGVLALSEDIRNYAAATGNLSPRLEAWNLAIQTTLADPVKLLFGSGFGYFGSGFLETRGVITRLHSAPIQLFTELGLVGLALFLLGAMPRLWRGLRSRDSLQVALAGGGVAFLAHQFVDNGLFGFTGVLFFCIVAILSQRQATQSVATVAGHSGDGVRTWL